jgi:secreted trypsin-like serine protease
MAILHCCSQGDSGGPVIHYNSDYQMYSQVGITSFGNNNCETGLAIYTKVSAYYQWIHENSCLQADGGLCPNWAQV